VGIIAQRIDELDGKLKFIYSTAREIDTSILQRDLERTVYEAFESLRPLRHRYIVLEAVYEGHNITVGKWLRLKDFYQRFGSLGSPINWPERFLKIIRVTGEHIAPVVRKPIRETFTKLVELTKRLKVYDEIEVSRKVDVKTRVRTLEGEWSVLHIREILVKTHRPDRLVYKSDDANGFYPSLLIDSWSDITMIEDLIEDMVKLYADAKAKVMEAKAYNDRLLHEIRSLASPYVVAKILTS